MSSVIGAHGIDCTGAKRLRRTVSAVVVVALIGFASREGSAAAITVTAHVPRLSVANSTPDYVDFQVLAEADVVWGSTPFAPLWSMYVEAADNPFVCDDAPGCPADMRPLSSGWHWRFDTDNSADVTMTFRIPRRERGATWYFRAYWDVQDLPEVDTDLSSNTTAWVGPWQRPLEPQPALPDWPTRLLSQGVKDRLVKTAIAAVPKAIVYCAVMNEVKCTIAVATIPFIGIVLVVDPPDPDYAAIAELRPWPKAGARTRCPRFPAAPRGVHRRPACALWKRAMRPYDRDLRAIATIFEALAVTANRFSTARSDGSLDGQWLQVAAAKYLVSQLKAPLARRRKSAAFVTSMWRWAGAKPRMSGSQLSRAARRLRKRLPDWATRRLTDRRLPWNEGLAAAIDMIEPQLRRGLDLRDFNHGQWPKIDLQFRFKEYESLQVATATAAEVDVSPEDRAKLHTVISALSTIQSTCDSGERDSALGRAHRAARRLAGAPTDPVQFAVARTELSEPARGCPGSRRAYESAASIPLGNRHIRRPTHQRAVAHRMGTRARCGTGRSTLALDEPKRQREARRSRL